MKAIHYIKALSLPVLFILTSSCGGGSDNTTPSYRIYKDEYFLSTGEKGNTSTYQYNQSGFLETQYTNRTDGTTSRKDTYEYDASGKLSRLLRDYSSNGILNYIFTFNYDSGVLSNLVAVNYGINGDDVYGTHSIKYFISNNKISKTEYDADINDAVIDNYTMFNYDSNGILFSIVDYDFSSQIALWKQTYVYHANGRLDRAETDQDNDGVIDSYRVYYYEQGPCVVPYLELNYICSDK